MLIHILVVNCETDILLSICQGLEILEQVKT